MNEPQIMTREEGLVEVIREKQSALMYEFSLLAARMDELIIIINKRKYERS